MRVLLIDDDQDILDLGVELFKMSGLECVAVDSPIAALDTLRDEKFSAVVADIVMPQMSGIELLAKLKDEGLHHRPFVFITGYASENPEAERLVDAGEADRIFVKPLQFYEVAEYLKTAESDRL